MAVRLHIDLDQSWQDIKFQRGLRDGLLHLSFRPHGLSSPYPPSLTLSDGASADQLALSTHAFYVLVTWAPNGFGLS